MAKNYCQIDEGFDDLLEPNSVQQVFRLTCCCSVYTIFYLKKDRRNDKKNQVYAILHKVNN